MAGEKAKIEALLKGIEKSTKTLEEEMADIHARIRDAPSQGGGLKWNKEEVLLRVGRVNAGMGSRKQMHAQLAALLG